jgi:phage FluMu protein Com
LQPDLSYGRKLYQTKRCRGRQSQAAITAGYWFLWVRCPACRRINAIDLRTLDRHRDAAVTSLIPALSCRSCRPNAPFAELVRLSRTSIADEMREEHRRRVLGE